MENKITFSEKSSFSLSENKKSKNELIKDIVASFLKRRNYIDSKSHDEPTYNSRSHDEPTYTLTSEQMAVALFADKATARVNSILYSTINNEPKQVMQHYLKWLNWLCNIKSWKVQKELWVLARPMLCHLYLETLRGNHQDKSFCLVQLRREYYKKLHKAHLNDSLNEENRKEITFHDDISEKVLDTLQMISTITDIESYSTVMSFRSCKYRLQLTTKAIRILLNYLAKHSHVILLQVLQTWFDIEIVSDDFVLSEQLEEDESIMDQTSTFELYDALDNIPIMAGMDDSLYDKMLLKDLEESITALDESPQPILLYNIYNSQNENAVCCGAVNKNVSLIAAGFESSEIRLWQKSCLPLLVPDTHSSSILIASNDCYVEDVDDSETKMKEAVLRGHSGRVHGLRFMESTEYLMSTSHDGTMRAWNFNEGACVAIYSGHNYPIWCLDTSAFGMYMATGSQDRTIRIWSPEVIYPLRLCIGHTLDVNCIRFHPNGLYIASGSADRTVRLWSVTDASLVRLMPVQRPVLAVDFSPDGRYLASAGEDNIISIWDLAVGSRVLKLRGHGDNVNCLCWSTNGNLYSSSLDGVIRVWNNPQRTTADNSSASSSNIVMQCLQDFDTSCSCILNLQNQFGYVISIGVQPYQNKD